MGDGVSEQLRAWVYPLWSAALRSLGEHSRGRVLQGVVETHTVAGFSAAPALRASCSPPLISSQPAGHKRLLDTDGDRPMASESAAAVE